MKNSIISLQIDYNLLQSRAAIAVFRLWESQKHAITNTDDLERAFWQRTMKKKLSEKIQHCVFLENFSSACIQCHLKNKNLKLRSA